MLVPLWLCILSLAVSGAAASFKHQLIETDQNDVVHEIAEFSWSEREKRSVPLFLKGISALRTLLSGAKRVRSQSWNFNNYWKPGDFHTAKDDFFEVVGRKAVKYSRTSRGSRGVNEVWTANVGDRRIRLKTLAYKGNPVIEVIDTNAKEIVKSGKKDVSKRKDYKIIYKKDPP